jgi:hypothetical protein|eukprot:COSAG01_NODE_504_length_16140_cov_40.890967_13_plen_278_part_00
MAESLPKWRVDMGGDVGFRNTPDHKDNADKARYPPAKKGSEHAAVEEREGWIRTANGLWLPTTYMDRLTPAPTPAPAAAAADLTTMSVKELKKRARALGATEEMIEDLDDADNIKAATVALVNKLSTSVAPAPAPPVAGTAAAAVPAVAAAPAPAPASVVAESGTGYSTGIVRQSFMWFSDGSSTWAKALVCFDVHGSICIFASEDSPLPDVLLRPTEVDETTSQKAHASNHPFAFSVQGYTVEGRLEKPRCLSIGASAPPPPRSAANATHPLLCSC